MNLPSRIHSTPSARLLGASCAVIAVLFAYSSSDVLAADPDAETLKQRALALAQSVTADDFAFTRTSRRVATEGGKDEERVTVERFDPRQPAAQRWTLASVNGRAPTAEELASYNKDSATRRAPTYGRIATYLGAPATAAAESRGRTRYRITALPKDSIIVNNADLSANAAAEATIDASAAVPFVEHVRFTLVKPMRVKLVAKIEKMEASTRYRLMPNGKPVPAEQVTDLTGSMLGKSGRIKTTSTYSDHRAVRD